MMRFGCGAVSRGQRARPRPGRRTGRLVGCLVAAALGATIAQAIAADDEDEEKALRTGQAVSVEKLLGEIRKRFEGRILKVELDRESRAGERVWVYEAKLLTPEGEVLKLEYDARSLELIEVVRPKPKTARGERED